MKILLLDIETAPNVAYVWGLWNQNISRSHLQQVSHILCYTAKWLGSDEIIFYRYTENPQFLETLYSLLDEADAVCTFNGAKFDIPIINRELLLAKFYPPSPYKQIDLFKVVKKQFKFQSASLANVCMELGLGEKKSPGMSVWIGCLAMDPKAWEKMEQYNKEDVRLLEALYTRLLPWISNHPNTNIQSQDVLCPRCGSSSYQCRGSVQALSYSYRRYRCNSCGGWFRDVKAEGLGSKVAVIQ